MNKKTTAKPKTNKKKKRTTFKDESASRSGYSWSVPVKKG